MTTNRFIRLVDNLGNEPEIGVFGEVKVAQPNPQISEVFNIPLDTNKRFIVSGSPISMFNGSTLKIVSGDMVQTKTNLRYRTAQTVEVNLTAQFKGIFTGTNEKSYAGLYDDYDGVFFGYLGSDFVAGYRNTAMGADLIQIVIPFWNVDTLTRYRIRYGYLGVGNISFEVKIKNQWKEVFIFETDNALDARTHIGSPIVPMRMECNHADTSMYSGSWNASTYGLITSIRDAPYFTEGDRSITVNVGQSAPIVGFRSKTTFSGKPNKVSSKLAFAEFTTGSEGIYKIMFYAYPAGSITDGTWEDIDTYSVLETNKSVAAIPIGGKLIFSTTVSVGTAQKATNFSSSSLEFDRLGLIANPSDEFLIVKKCLVDTGDLDDTTSWNIAYLDLI